MWACIWRPAARYDRILPMAVSPRQAALTLRRRTERTLLRERVVPPRSGGDWPRWFVSGSVSGAGPGSLGR